MQETGTCWRDLESANILIEQGDSGPPRVKLADFGVSTFRGGPEGSTARRQQRGTDGGPATRRDGAEPQRRLAAEELDGDSSDGDSSTVSLEAQPATRERQPEGDEAVGGEGAEGPLAEAADDAVDRAGEAEQLTQSGILIGTPMYMAPELSEGSHNAQPPSDIFSLGVIAYELLSGEIPFVRPPVWARWRGTERPAPSLLRKRPDLAGELVALVDGCLQLDPAQRPTAAAIAAALRKEDAAPEDAAPEDAAPEAQSADAGRGQLA